MCHWGQAMPFRKECKMLGNRAQSLAQSDAWSRYIKLKPKVNLHWINMEWILILSLAVHQILVQPVLHFLNWISLTQKSRWSLKIWLTPQVYGHVKVLNISTVCFFSFFHGRGLHFCSCYVPVPPLSHPHDNLGSRVCYLGDFPKKKKSPAKHCAERLCEGCRGVMVGFITD